MILDNLKTAECSRRTRKTRSSSPRWPRGPDEYICAEGRYLDGDGKEKRAAIFDRPEFGTVSRADLVSAAREAGDAAFDVLIACAFSYDAHSAEFNKLGRIRVLKARMNADLHMADGPEEHRQGQSVRHLRRAGHHRFWMRRTARSR